MLKGLTVGPTGTYSGALLIGGTTYSISGITFRRRRCGHPIKFRARSIPGGAFDIGNDVVVIEQ